MSHDEIRIVLLQQIESFGNARVPDDQARETLVRNTMGQVQQANANLHYSQLMSDQQKEEHVRLFCSTLIDWIVAIHYPSDRYSDIIITTAYCAWMNPFTQFCIDRNTGPLDFRSLLQTAAEQHRSELVNWLVAKGLDLNVHYDYTESPGWSTLTSHATSTEFLLQLAALYPVRMSRDDASLTLATAMMRGLPDMIHFWLERGARLTDAHRGEFLWFDIIHSFRLLDEQLEPLVAAYLDAGVRDWNTRGPCPEYLEETIERISRTRNIQLVDWPPRPYQ